MPLRRKMLLGVTVKRMRIERNGKSTKKNYGPRRRMTKNCVAFKFLTIVLIWKERSQNRVPQVEGGRKDTVPAVVAVASR